jgi:hypothetical protein
MGRLSKRRSSISEDSKEVFFFFLPLPNPRSAGIVVGRGGQQKESIYKRTNVKSIFVRLSRALSMLCQVDLIGLDIRRSTNNAVVSSSRAL